MVTPTTESDPLAFNYPNHSLKLTMQSFKVNLCKRKAVFTLGTGVFCFLGQFTGSKDLLFGLICNGLNLLLGLACNGLNLMLRLNIQTLSLDPCCMNLPCGFFLNAFGYGPGTLNLPSCFHCNTLSLLNHCKVTRNIKVGLIQGLVMVQMQGMLRLDCRMRIDLGCSSLEAYHRHGTVA